MWRIRTKAKPGLCLKAGKNTSQYKNTIKYDKNSDEWMEGAIYVLIAIFSD